MNFSLSTFDGLEWDDVKERPLWKTSMQWDSRNKKLWPVLDDTPDLDQDNPQNWPGKVILVDTWVKLVDENMSQIRQMIRAGSGDVEEMKEIHSVLSELLVEKWPLNFGPDAKPFSKQPKKPVDPKRPTCSILSLPETPQITTDPNFFLNPTDNDTHQYHLEASNSSTAIGNTAENSTAITSMRSAEQAQDKNQQSTAATQVSTSHRNHSRTALRLKFASVSPSQPGAAGRREQPKTTNKSLTFKPNPEKTSSLRLQFGPRADGRSVPVMSLSKVTANKAAATQSSNGQSLQIPPQDNPRLSGGLANAIKTFRTIAGKALKRHQERDKESEKELSESHRKISGLQAELSECNKKIIGLQAELEEEHRKNADHRKTVLQLQGQALADKDTHGERERKLMTECEEKDAILGQTKSRLREVEQKLKESEKEIMEGMELMEEATKHWEDDMETLSSKRQRIQY